MTKNDTIQAMAVMQAYVNGTPIQSKERTSSEWLDFSEYETPTWDWRECNYRIKPEPELRPFKDGVECFKEMAVHQPCGWIHNKFTGDYDLIVSVQKDSIYLAGDDVLSYSLMSEDYTFADGAPFGVIED